MKLIIISGRSGTGKSVSLHMLEDLGFYCIDGLPVNLLSTLTGQLHNAYTKVAVSIDARNIPREQGKIDTLLSELKALNPDTDIIFLDADDQTLLKRFSETRRKHPLSNDRTSLNEALYREEQLLHPIYHLADLQLNTDKLSVHDLRERIRTYIQKETPPGLTLLFLSFGYKHGIPQESDFIFDVRCLANPYWEPELREYNGLQPAIIQFLERHPETEQLVTQIAAFLEEWIPHFEAANRQYMTIAIGCTGGQHRSVYVVERLTEQFKPQHLQIQNRHRELL